MAFLKTQPSFFDRLTPAGKKVYVAIAVPIYYALIGGIGYFLWNTLYAWNKSEAIVILILAVVAAGFWTKIAVELVRKSLKT